MSLSEKESFYARRYAALLLSDVGKPESEMAAYLVQEQAGGYIPVSNDEFEDKKESISLVEYGCEGYNTYKSVEELVASILGFDYKSKKELDEYNQQAATDGLPLFVSYEKAVDGNIPGYARSVCDVNDYLWAYGINPDMVSFYQRPDVYSTNAISFTKKGAEHIVADAKDYAAHPYRILPISTFHEDFPVLMNLLYRIGKRELDKETAGYKFEEKFCWTNEEIIEEMMNHPHQSFEAAKYHIKFPVSRTINGVEFGSMDMTFTICGCVRKAVGCLFPDADISVSLDAHENGHGFHKECAYPFDIDNTLQALRGEDGLKLSAVDMFNYMMYM